VAGLLRAVIMTKGPEQSRQEIMHLLVAGEEFPLRLDVMNVSPMLITFLEQCCHGGVVSKTTTETGEFENVIHVPPSSEFEAIIKHIWAVRTYYLVVLPLTHTVVICRDLTDCIFLFPSQVCQGRQTTESLNSVCLLRALSPRAG